MKCCRIFYPFGLLLGSWLSTESNLLTLLHSNIFIIFLKTLDVCVFCNLRVQNPIFFWKLKWHFIANILSLLLWFYETAACLWTHSRRDEGVTSAAQTKTSLSFLQHVSFSTMCLHILFDSSDRSTMLHQWQKMSPQVKIRFAVYNCNFAKVQPHCILMQGFTYCESKLAAEKPVCPDSQVDPD